jgi:hypothetical protein
MWTIQRFEHEIHKFDPLLRVRVSKLNPAEVIIERKAGRETKCVPTPKERRGIDRWISDSQGFVPVTRAYRHQLNHNTLLELRAQDMWEHRGAGYFADKLETQELYEKVKQEQHESEVLQNCGEEAYDRGMIKQGSVVSNFTSKVGGYEPSTN